MVGWDLSPLTGEDKTNPKLLWINLNNLLKRQTDLLNDGHGTAPSAQNRALSGTFCNLDRALQKFSLRSPFSTSHNKNKEQQHILLGLYSIGQQKTAENLGRIICVFSLSELQVNFTGPSLLARLLHSSRLTQRGCLSRHYRNQSRISLGACPWKWPGEVTGWGWWLTHADRLLKKRLCKIRRAAVSNNK